MRVIVIIFTILTILFGGVYFLSFTQSGNDIVKPYLEKYISKKIQKEVNIDKFTLKTNHISLQATVPQEANLMLDGGIDLFKQGFDLIYQINAQNLKTPTITIRDNLEVHGNIKGLADDFTAKGEGVAFDSNINFNLHLIDKKPQDGVINAKGINTEKVLELVGKPAYTKGLVDIVAKIQDKDGALVGGADVIIHKSTINEKLVFRDFNLSIPKGITYVGNIQGDVKGDELNAISEIKSSLATLKTKNTHVNLKTHDIYSDYALHVKNLQELEFLTTKKLFGSLLILGDIKKSKKDLVINAKSDIYDGKFSAKLHNDKLVARGKDLQIKKILAMLGEPALAYGIVDFEADVKDLLDKKADLSLNISKGELVGSLMRSKYGVDFPPITNFTGSLLARVAKDLVEANTNLKTTLLNISAKKSVIDLKTQNITSDFNVKVDDLSYIGNIVKQDLKGEFSTDGDVKFEDKVLSFNAHTESLGGKIDVDMKKNTLLATIKDVSVEKILSILNKPTLAKGSMNATAKFDNLNPENLNGTFNYTLNNGLLLGKGLKEFSNIDFPESSSFAIKSDMDVKNGFANFTNSINSELASIPDFKGTYDIKNKVLDSSYHVDIKDLSKLAFITKQTLYGPFQASGIVQMRDENLKVTADAPILGGQSKSLFDEKKLTSQALNISTKGLSELLGMPYVFDSQGNFDLRYNTASKKGDYILLMKKGKLVQTKLSTLVKNLLGYDMTKEVYEDTILKGNIDDTQVTYNLDLNGSQTSLSIPDGVYDMLSNQTKATFKLKLQKTDFEGSISGDVGDPKIRIDTSKYLKKKAKKELNKQIDKHIPEKQKGIVKDILKMF